MLVELHSHTHHSRGTKIHFDAVDSPETMVRTAASKGIGALAVTDHNTIEGALKAKRYAKKYGVIVITGEEITTASGHLLAIGIHERIAPGMGVDATVDAIHSQGGIAVASHPFDIKHEGIREECVKCDAVEAFNALNIERFANMRCARFAADKKLKQVAGSDAHSCYMLGNGLNAVSADSIDDILSAIRKGKNEMVTQYATPSAIMDLVVRRLQMSYPHVLKYIEKNYKGPKKYISRNMLGMVQKSPGTIDYLFKGMFYLSLGNLIIYSALRSAVGK